MYTKFSFQRPIEKFWLILSRPVVAEHDTVTGIWLRSTNCSLLALTSTIERAVESNALETEHLRPVLFALMRVCFNKRQHRINYEERANWGWAKRVFSRPNNWGANTWHGAKVCSNIATFISNRNWLSPFSSFQIQRVWPTPDLK